MRNILVIDPPDMDIIGYDEKGRPIVALPENPHNDDAPVPRDPEADPKTETEWAAIMEHEGPKGGHGAKGRKRTKSYAPNAGDIREARRRQHGV
jgi:hypothetical protein